MDNIIIIPFLLFSNKIQLNIIINNLTFGSINFTISNLNNRTRKQYKKLNIFLLGLILI